jgi:uncharacterized protein YndB with AHSA1/START domain
MVKQTTASNKITKDLNIERTFNAPRALLWQAWTNPEIIRRWWGPRSFTAPYIKIDPRVGGTYLYCIRSSEGKNYWTTGIYLEINEPARIVMTESFANETGEVVSAAYYGFNPDFPLESKLSIRFGEISRKTSKLRFTYHSVPVADIDKVAAAWNQSLDKIAGQLPDIDIAQI